MPESASTWCGLSDVPSASLRLLVGEHSLETPAAARNDGATWSRGPCRPASISAMRGVESLTARRPGASAVAAESSPSWTKGSRVNSSARVISAGSGIDAASAAAVVESAIYGFVS